MHKQGLKFERHKVVLNAEGFERTGASLIVYKSDFGIRACVCLTYACASEHMCAQACATAYAHVCTYNFMCTCVRFRAHVRANMCSGMRSCVHHEHVHALQSTCAHKRVMAYAHVCTQNFMCTCMCFRARVRASMCRGIHSCVHQVHMRVLPSTRARKHV